MTEESDRRSVGFDLPFHSVLVQPQGQPEIASRHNSEGLGKLFLKRNGNGLKPDPGALLSENSDAARGLGRDDFHSVRSAELGVRTAQLPQTDDSGRKIET